MTPAPANAVPACNNLALRKAARYLGATYDKALAEAACGPPSSASSRC
ncbi:hypothetical protein ACFQ1I_05000 [Kitasatospora arboriphila]